MSDESASADLLDVVFPAGGRIGGAFAVEAGAVVKALVRIDGRTLLERALDAVRATGRLRRAVVVGPPGLADCSAAARADAVIPEGATGPENILRGIEWLSPDGSAGRVLVCMTDLPFVTAGAVGAFLDLCPRNAALCAPLVGVRRFMERFPGSSNRWVRLRDGAWTMGGLFVVDTAMLAARRDVVERAFAARKSQLAMARLLGLRFVARLMCRRLTIAHVARRCEEIMGCPVAAIADSPPELAYDIDDPPSYRYARAALEAASTA